MAYQITHVRRDIFGTTTHVLAEGMELPVDTVVSHINNGTRSYYTLVNGQRADVLVKSNGAQWYLTTSADWRTDNNLDELPTF